MSRDVQAGDFGRAHEIRCVIDLHFKPGFLETIHKIISIKPDVIFLHEESQTLGRIGDGKIFKSGPSVREARNHDHSPTVWLQDSYKFAHCLPVIWNVFQNMTANDDVKGVFRKRDLRNIQAYIDPGIQKVGCHVSVAN